MDECEKENENRKKMPIEMQTNTSHAQVAQPTAGKTYWNGVFFLCFAVWFEQNRLGFV